RARSVAPGNLGARTRPTAAAFASLESPSKHHARFPARLNRSKPNAGADFQLRSAKNYRHYLHDEPKKEILPELTAHLVLRSGNRQASRLPDQQICAPRGDHRRALQKT